MNAPAVRSSDVLAVRSATAELRRREQARRWYDDPAAWVTERLGEDSWSKQAEVLRAVAEYPLVAVQSAHSTGKSHGASRLVGWFLDTRPSGQAFVVTTAPTNDQVRAILWRYIGQMWNAHELPGWVTQDAKWKFGTELVAYGRKPSDYDESAFQGIHAKHLLIILDEACGVPEQLWIAADSLATSVDSHILAIGNPDTTSSHFYRVCTTEPGWHRIKISALDTPNFTDEPVSDQMRDTLVQRSWVEDKRMRWGEASPLYRAKVLGEFADDADGLIPLSWVVAANQRWLDWQEKTDHRYEQPPGRIILGVDVGHLGGDETVIATRQGWVIKEIEAWRYADTMTTAALVETRLRAYGQSSMAVIDSVGVGAGVLDRLRQRRCTVRPFVAGAATKRRDQTGTQGFSNCLTSDARVTPIGDLLRVYRVPYQGPLFNVDMASGDHFTATANHQVLTRGGWVSVQAIHVGDQLINPRWSEAEVSGAAPEVHNVPPTFSEVYGAAARLFGTERMNQTAVNFHGDRPSGEVDVVTVDRDLLSVDPPDGQHAQDVALVRLLVAQRLLPVDGATVGKGLAAHAGEGPIFPRDCVSGGERYSLGQGHVFVPQEIGFRHRSRSDALLDQCSGDGSVMHREGASDGFSRFSGLVAFGNIGGVQTHGSSQCDGLWPCAQVDSGFEQHAAYDVAVNFQRCRKATQRFSSVVSIDDLGAWKGWAEGKADGFGLVSDMDALGFQNRFDSAPIGSEPLTQSDQCFSGFITTDQVIGIEIQPDSLRHGSGSYVYTLETSSGTYATTSVVHKNCRSAAWWNLRELLDPAGDASVCLPPDDELAADLTTPRWESVTGGKIKVESKDEIRKRLKRSTDRGDACVQAFWTDPSTFRDTGDAPKKLQVRRYSGSRGSSFRALTGHRR